MSIFTADDLPPIAPDYDVLDEAHPRLRAPEFPVALDPALREGQPSHTRRRPHSTEESSVRTEAEIRADARDRRPFSNHTEWELWSYTRCDDCCLEPACPLILVALDGKTPTEWTVDPDGTTGDCSEFEPIPTSTDDDPEEPAGRLVETVHIPVLDGQLDLLGGDS